MFRFKFCYVALAVALASTTVYADPISYKHHTGTKIIDIEAPNSAGVSHNTYREFNVDSQGVILNNSDKNYTQSTFGNIAKNPNLTNGSASVILNEVTSNKASTLNGFIEVGGQKADVVIANPNGITCSGCSFINANKVVMTTGTVNSNDAGSIINYQVKGGNVTIDKNGLNAANSYVAILADAININGNLTAANAVLSGGNFTFDNTTGRITSAGKSANLWQSLFPAYSIDISRLGGVSANSITMVGNNFGFGVRNKGAVVANSTLAMTSLGSLVNQGSVTNTGIVTQMVAAGDLNNSGRISGNYMTVLNSLKNLNNEGSIASNNQLSISALGNIDSSGSIGGKYTAIGFSGDRMKVSGNISGTENLLIQAMKDNVLTGAEIFNAGKISGKNVTIQSNGSLTQYENSRLEASNSLTTQTYWVNNSGYIGSADGDVKINNTVTHNHGLIEGSALAINTKLELLNNGSIRARNDAQLSTQGMGNIVNRGNISAGKTLTLTAKKVENGGYRCGFFWLATCGKGTLSADSMVLNSAHNNAAEMGGTRNIGKIEMNALK